MQSMDEIYQKYAKRVYKYLLSLIHNQDVAEELTQETFYQAIQNIDGFDGSCKVSTWLCAIEKISCVPISENIHLWKIWKTMIGQ